MKWILGLSALALGGSAFAEPPSASIGTALPAGLELGQVTRDKAAKVERVVAWKGGVAVFASSDKTTQRGDATFWSKTLYVTTFADKDGKLKKLREVKEVVPPCDLDMSAKFFHPAAGLEVTDLDADGTAELTFGYVTRCAGDVSPSAMKVLVLEGSDKFILRGESKVDVGNGEIVGGTFKTDFGKAPAPFVEHAKAFWNANVGP